MRVDKVQLRQFGGNPFLPLDEFIADGEPHVFGDRVYLFGSHDREGGDKFCELDYVGYSAPVNDLTNWKCEGTIYRVDQDPDYMSTGERVYLYAPDVVRGNDGRYYLYYTTESFSAPLRVAVCDEPVGNYSFYGFVRNADGSPFTKRIPFDPAVINDDGVVRLYYGWGLHLPGNLLTRLSMEITARILFGKVRDKGFGGNIMGAYTVELERDMLTVKTEPRLVVPCRMEAGGTEFEAHAFYEGSSIRKIKGKYYFIYSSHVNHELCYAVSDQPDCNFRYGGVIISNGDIGYQGRTAKEPLNVTGNNHGSVEEINGQWYVFCHRHTHNRSCCRQACAERITILPDGSIPQVEMTTQGMREAPLAEGVYAAVTACNLWRGRMKHIVNGVSKADQPYISHDESDRFITNIKSGTNIGYKFVSLTGRSKFGVVTRGSAGGTLEIYAGDVKLGEILLQPGQSWKKSETGINYKGTVPLYICYRGPGSFDFKEFCVKRDRSSVI